MWVRTTAVMSGTVDNSVANQIKEDIRRIEADIESKVANMQTGILAAA